MPTKNIEIELTLDVDSRLKDEANRGVSKSDFAVLAIRVAHYMMLKLSDQSVFYKGKQILPMPPPDQDRSGRFGKLALYLSSDLSSDLDDICLNYAIDRLSVLSWGIDCIDRINEAMKHEPILVRGRGKTYELDPVWLR